MKIYVGTSGYSYKEWQNRFYPARMPPGEMLPFYAGRFEAVEINNTFYRMPTEKVLNSWAAQVPENFRFAVKAPRVMTHFKRLKGVDEEADYLFTTLGVLGARLGPVLFQFPASFHADKEALRNFLGQVPGQIRGAWEFRHPSWLQGGILDLLRENESSLCFTDTDEAPVTELISTAPWGYLRLRRSGYTDLDLQQWLKRIRAQPWETAFVFFKHEDKARGPELAGRLAELDR
jgi:uncharacterized protein YecE (DUF72 family)